MTNKVSRSGDELLFDVSLQRLARHLPLLGGILGVVALSAGAMTLANRVTGELLGNGGDVTALVTGHLRGLSVALVKASAMGEQVLVFLGPQ